MLWKAAIASKYSTPQFYYFDIHYQAKEDQLQLTPIQESIVRYKCVHALVYTKYLQLH